MNRINVMILFGGQSTEHEVSLQSAAAVVEHIPLDRYEPHLVGITLEGQWLYYDGDIDGIRNGNWSQHSSCRPAIISPDYTHKGLVLLDAHGPYKMMRIDCVFPVLHGKNGEDGSVQGLLQLAGIPYVGCGLLSSAISMDKAVAQDLVKSSGMATTDYLHFTKHSGMSLHALDKQIMNQFGGYPVFVKPANSGSSVGITRVRDMGQLGRALEHAFTFDNRIICEKEVLGIEVGCAVYGNDELETGIVGEIVPSREFLDYADKYLLGHIQQYVPARISRHLQEEVRQTGMEIYRILGCKGMARVDFFITREGKVLFNEINTMPGFTPSSRFPRMIEAAGISYGQFIDKLIQLSLADRVAAAGVS